MIAEPIEIPEDEVQTAMLEEQAREETIEESLGVTADEYRQEVEKKYGDLMKERGKSESPDELLKKAFRIVEEKYG